VERESYEIEHTVCPNCGKIANKYDEVKRDFGYRNMGDGRIIVQSWCRECRIEERRQNS
jgi:hypothetical protein